MRVVLAVLFVVGCAQGGRTNLASDGDITPLDGTIEQPVDAMADAKPPADAAPPVDAPPPIDAAPPVDAPPAQMPDAYQCTVMSRQLLVNPVLDLDANGTGWTQVNIDNMYPVITAQGFAAQTAPYKAWMGGFEAPLGQTVTDMLYQDVQVPMGTTMLRLTGYYAVGTQETGTTVYDTGQLALVQTNGTPIEVVLSLNNTTTTGSAWVAIDRSFANAASLSGQTVRLRMISSNDDSFVTNYFFDSYALTATYCQ